MPLLLSAILVAFILLKPVQFFELLDRVQVPEWLVVGGSTVLFALDFHELAILIAEFDFDLMLSWIEISIPLY